MQELILGSGTLYYEVNKEEITVTGYRGTDVEVRIPERIEDRTVTTIGKKAFLSKKGLVKISLPDTVTQIEDWAFAYCDELREITIPHRALHIGRQVFLDCGKLERIRLQGSDEASLAVLLAVAVTDFQAYYLFEPEVVGDREWLEKWDARLGTILLRSDTEGYSKQVLCGEEDYGSTDLSAYISSRRAEKARLCFLRLVHNTGCSAELQTKLQDYIKTHTKGCESEEGWKVLLEQFGDDRDYYEMFYEMGCVTADNKDAILADLGDQYPEMKAYILKQTSGNDTTDDFFDDLEL